MNGRQYSAPDPELEITGVGGGGEGGGLQKKKIFGPGTRFSSFAASMIKLSVNETKWRSLLARTRALLLYISI